MTVILIREQRINISIIAFDKWSLCLDYETKHCNENRIRLVNRSSHLLMMLVHFIKINSPTSAEESHSSSKQQQKH